MTHTQSAGTPVMASVCGLMFVCLRFAQEVLYHLHLSWCEDAFVATVAEVGEGLQQASGVSYFLAEEVYGTLVAMVGVIEQGQAAEVALLAPFWARGAMGGSSGKAKYFF